MTEQHATLIPAGDRVLMQGDRAAGDVTARARLPCGALTRQPADGRSDAHGSG